MRVRKQRLYSKNQTGDELKRLSRSYWMDLLKFKSRYKGRLTPLAYLPIRNFFDIIKRIPYQKDKKPVEVVKRPLFSILSGNADCKKKSIIIASYCIANNIPHRFIITSTRPDKKPHHVLVQVYNKRLKKWLNIDSTYARNKIFHSKPVTHWEVL